VKLLQRLIECILTILLHRILRYRLAIVKDNLSRAFSLKDRKGLQRDVAAYYRYLGKIARQILLSPTQKRLKQHVSLHAYPQINDWLADRQSVIVVMGHVGNWEWAGAYIMMSYYEHACALYKKIKAKRINALLYRRRNLSAKFLVESGQMGELLRLMKRQPVVILMIADQNPGSDQGIIWTKFLGRETAFANGPESLSTRYKLPVVYAHIDPQPNGKYEVSFIPIYDGKETVSPGEITRRFATALENNILRHRHEWLWSHRRWKRNREKY
jgi:KDO2-lipid IV(A) lauroyltransferase